MLGETIHITSNYLGHEVKAVSARSKVDALEVKSAKLRRDLISVMEEAKSGKERAKVLADKLKVEKQLSLEKDRQLQVVNQKVNTMAAKAVEAFQQNEEYNTVLFNWYYKGFELLRRYLAKHPSRVDLEILDFEAVDQEMEIDEVSNLLSWLLRIACRVGLAADLRVLLPMWPVGTKLLLSYL